MKELIQVPGLKPEEKVIIKKYSYGDQAKLAAKIAKINIKNMQAGLKAMPEAEPDLYAAKIYPLVYGVISAPFFPAGASELQKVKAVEGLEQETGEFLLQELNRHNGQVDVDEAQKK